MMSLLRFFFFLAWTTEQPHCPACEEQPHGGVTPLLIINSLRWMWHKWLKLSPFFKLLSFEKWQLNLSCNLVTQQHFGPVYSAWSKASPFCQLNSRWSGRRVQCMVQSGDIYYYIIKPIWMLSPIPFKSQMHQGLNIFNIVATPCVIPGFCWRSICGERGTCHLDPC